MLSLVYEYSDFFSYLIEGFLLIAMLICMNGSRWKLPVRICLAAAFCSGYACLLFYSDFSAYSVSIIGLRYVGLLITSIVMSESRFSVHIMSTALSLFLLITATVISRIICILIIGPGSELPFRLILIQLLPDIHLLYIYISDNSGFISGVSEKAFQVAA